MKKGRHIVKPKNIPSKTPANNKVKTFMGFPKFPLLLMMDRYKQKLVLMR